MLGAVKDEPASLGGRLRKLRRDRELTQKWVADQIGIAQSSVSDWEADQSIPELGNLLTLAGILMVDVNHLVYGLSTTYDRLGLTGPVTSSSIDRGTQKGSASDVSASAQTRIRELEAELDALKTAIAESALILSDLVGDERLRTARTPQAKRRRKGRKTG